MHISYCLTILKLGGKEICNIGELWISCTCLYNALLMLAVEAESISYFKTWKME